MSPLDLSGCQLPLTPAPPQAALKNSTIGVLCVAVEGLASDLRYDIQPQQRVLRTVDACLGTSLRVETMGRDLVGTVDGPLWPDWTLTINEDGTITYTEDEEY